MRDTGRISESTLIALYKQTAQNNQTKYSSTIFINGRVFEKKNNATECKESEVCAILYKPR